MPRVCGSGSGCGCLTLEALPVSSTRGSAMKPMSAPFTSSTSLPSHHHAQYKTYR